MSDEKEFYDSVYGSYEHLDQIDFSIITSKMKWLPFFNEDLFLGMQVMNVGVVDAHVTQYEYALLQEYIEIERTPSFSAMNVSALSQMWIFALYEVLRVWRQRHYEFDKLFKNGGIDSKIEHWEKDAEMNLALLDRIRQIKEYRDNEKYRDCVNKMWVEFEEVYRMVELFRMNLAKHVAPGKNNVIPRAPGYGRINMFCGSMDYELISKEGYYRYLNRRNIADTLRLCIESCDELRKTNEV